MESRKFTERQRVEMVVTRGREVAEMRCWSKDTNLPLCRVSNSEDLMCGIMILVVSNAILNTGDLLRK